MILLLGKEWVLMCSLLAGDQGRWRERERRERGRQVLWAVLMEPGSRLESLQDPQPLLLGSRERMSPVAHLGIVSREFWAQEG